jgi:hypothetical protein
MFMCEIFFSRAKTVKTVMVSCGIFCCLAITLFSSITTYTNVSQTRIIPISNITNIKDLTKGTIELFLKVNYSIFNGITNNVIIM